jgi:hypothetical protein
MRKINAKSLLLSFAEEKVAQGVRDESVAVHGKALCSAPQI